jgi:hypothetical protein
MDVGRIHCKPGYLTCHRACTSLLCIFNRLRVCGTTGFLVATRGGDVIYERFFDRFTELEKADIRAAFSAASNNSRMHLDSEQDFIAPYK